MCAQNMYGENMQMNTESQSDYTNFAAIAHLLCPVKRHIPFSSIGVEKINSRYTPTTYLTNLQRFKQQSSKCNRKGMVL